MLTMNDGPLTRLLGTAALCALTMAGATLLGLGPSGVLLVAISCVGTALIFHLIVDAKPPADVPASPVAAAGDLIGNDSFTRILDGLTDPMFVVDRGRIVLANKASLRLLGTHIVGEDARIAIRHPAAAEYFAGHVELQEPVTASIIGLGNRARSWQLQIVPIDLNAPGQRLLVRLTDQSARLAAERARVDFVANASHELRTPLAAILGFVETLGDAKAGGDPPTRARFLKIVENEARRMQQLVDDLMSLSRIEADKHKTPEAFIDFAMLTQEVVEVSRVSLTERGKEIVLGTQDDLPTILGDRAQLSQVIHNLVDNAAKYGRPGTPISVSVASASANMIKLEVADEGEGIAREHLPRLTERFYRVDSGRSRAMGGTGLGLAIVKHIVERHRGRLDILSTPGKGTTVVVQLPCAPETQGQEDLSAASVRLPAATSSN